MQWRRCLRNNHSFGQAQLEIGNATYEIVKRLHKALLYVASGGKSIVATNVDGKYRKETV